MEEEGSISKAAPVQLYTAPFERQASSTAPLQQCCRGPPIFPAVNPPKSVSPFGYSGNFGISLVTGTIHYQQQQQARKQASNQASKQASKQASNQASRQADEKARPDHPVSCPIFSHRKCARGEERTHCSFYLLCRRSSPGTASTALQAQRGPKEGQAPKPRSEGIDLISRLCPPSAALAGTAIIPSTT